jgi:iron(III) transport system substrate-binding protein
MAEWRPKVRHSLAAAVAILAVAGLLPAGCRNSVQPPAAAEDELVIYSPHSDEIREEFAWGFQDWYLRQTGRTVAVQWPDAGGTSQMLRRLQDKFKAGRFDVDVAFGGGSPTFDDMKQLGMLEQFKLPAALLEAIPREVAGQQIYDPDHYWYGAALTTFGLIYNRKIIRDRRLPPVTTWEALADPAYFGLVGAGDAAKSGSMRTAYEIILEAYGYERGMAMLIRMFANAREIYPGAGEIPRDCAQGFIAAGPCIDFYADRQMHSDGGEDLGYVAPKGLTVLNADPIGIFKNAPHRKVAEKFLEYVLGADGQSLWVLAPGSPGGPRQFALERPSILPSVLERLDVAARRGETTNPFTLPVANFYDPAKGTVRVAILPDYLRVAAVENERALKRAWKAVIDAGLPPDLVAELVRPLISEDEMIWLGRQVWPPIRVPADATPEQADELRRSEEMRLRQKSELLREWRQTLSRRYNALAARAAAGT